MSEYASPKICESSLEPQVLVSIFGGLMIRLAITNYYTYNTVYGYLIAVSIKDWSLI